MTALRIAGIKRKVCYQHYNKYSNFWQDLYFIVFVFKALIINVIAATGTEFKCEALPGTHTINTCVTDDDVTTCYCDTDDCNVGDGVTQLKCNWKEGGGDLSTKEEKSCQHGIVNCKQVKTSK